MEASTKEIKNRVINHKTMRVIVGIIALLLAPMVWFFSEPGIKLDSISISYWTDAQDIFVGSLVVVGFFLSAYNGTEGKRDWEFYLSKLACLFAILVALFPTEGFYSTDTPPGWTDSVAGIFGLQSMNIHYGAAVLLFGCLIAMMRFFSKRALGKGKIFRSRLYFGIYMSMLLGIIGIFMLGKFIFYWSNTVLIVEVWGLSLFGFGWLLAGSYKSIPALD